LEVIKLKKVKKSQTGEPPAAKEKEDHRQNVQNWIIAVSSAIVAIVELARFILDLIK
jgi:hypothetical protein